MFTVDRVQYSEILGQLVIFEFMEIESLDDISYSDGEVDFTKCVNRIDVRKLEFLIEASKKNYVFLIITNTNDDRLLLFSYKDGQLNDKRETNFQSMSKWFVDWNNYGGKEGRESKVLGSVKEESFDSYVNGILGELYEVSNYKDDCGIKLTKRLLGKNPTRGFDLDLYCYDKDENKNIIIEFLKRDTEYVNNITANPMRYCWTGKINDNKRKFIGLWNAKRILDAELFLVNYSENPNENIGISHITKLDELSGIKGEEKYIVDRSGLMTWLKSACNQEVLSKYYYKSYDEEYYNMWINNKSSYGKKGK